MPDFDFNKISTATRDTPTTISGVFAGLAVQNGTDIQDDKVRYIWRIRATNNNAAIHDLVVWSGDVLALPGSSRRRVLLRLTIPALGQLDYPVDASPDAPVIRLPPNTAGGAGLTQENEIYCTDEAGGTLVTNISMSYFDKRA